MTASRTPSSYKAEQTKQLRTEQDSTPVSTKWVYAFNEGNRDQKYLLGGKGANLAEMTNLGLPVPPGFTITTVACNDYMQHDNTLPADLMDQVSAAREALEA